MTIIETKYSIGDVVYHASIRTVTKQHPCPDCKGARKWNAISPAGAEYEFACPRCSANYQANSDLSLKYSQYEPFTSRLTIGSVRSDSHGDRKVEYMCDEADLFLTDDEARTAGAIKAKLANTEVEWVAKLYDKTLRLSDYELTSAERTANRDKHSAAMIKIRNFFDDLDYSDDLDAMRKLISDFRETAYHSSATHRKAGTAQTGKTKMAYIAKTPLHMALWDAGGEFEVDAVITYTVTKFSPATIEQPEEPAMAEVSSFKLQKPKTGEWLACPAWISDAFESDDGFMNWLVSEAADHDEYAKECAAEARAEEAWLDARA